MNIFTNDDYRRIQAWLKANAIKDSDFAISENTVPDEDILVITQNMSTVPTNYRIRIKDLLNSSLTKIVIDSITAKSVKVNNVLTVDAANVKLDNEKGTTLQDVLNYFEDNKLNRYTDDTFDGNLTVKKNITIEGNIKSHDNTITVEANLEATGEITDGHGNQLNDVNSATKNWRIEYQDPAQDEPTVRAKYVLKDYKGVPKGSVIKIYKDSAITNVYLGTTEDTCNPDTGEVTKHEIHNNNEALSIVYRLDTGKYMLVNVPIGIFTREAEFDKYRGLGIEPNGQVFVKLASDVESTNYLHFNSLGEIAADGIEARILRDLGNIITSIASDGTMWGVYKEHEGTQETSTSNDGSRWGEFKRAEEIREQTSDSAHTVFADNWDEQDDDPEDYNPLAVTEASYAYNWKTTDTPADDGKTEGNLKDLYQKTLNQDSKLSELENEVGIISSKFNSGERKDIDINSLVVTNRRPNEAVWGQASSSSHSVIEISSRSVITISNGAPIGYYCFLKDYLPTDPENGIPPKYAEGYSDLVGIAENTTETIKAPSDAKYLLIMRTIFSSECSPKSVMVEKLGRKLDVEFDTIVGGKGLYTKKGKFINFENGEEIVEDSFSATDFLLITKDVDIIVSGVNSGVTAILAFYDKDKNFINVSYNFLKEKKVSVADIPANAMYIRSSSFTSALGDETRIQVASLGGLSSLVSNDNDTGHDDNLLIDINAISIKELDRYPRITTHTISGSEFARTKIYDVRNVKKVNIIYQDVAEDFGIAFSTNCDDRAGFNVNTRIEWWTAYPSKTGSVSVNVPTGALYLAVEKESTKDVIVTTYGELKEYTRNPYFGKTCIYMGDSISTSNGFYWKGYLESFFGIKYTRNKQGELWPALGGMTLMPPTSDEESFWTSQGKDIKDHASIWYRCANHRMKDLGYVFDMISIFGGTNDMINETLKVGDIDTEGNWVNVSAIKPYVDDTSTFANPSKYTSIFSGDITFAQCLMGCIEMMHRDFPTMKIIIPTVMPCGGNCGNYIFSKEASPANGLSLSERIAILAIKIVERYIDEGLDIVSVPLYWDSRNVKNISAFSYFVDGTNDGIHPNHTQAKRMAALVKEALMF